MTDTYGTTVIPSDEITVRSGSTVAISVAFETTLGLVGGMDTSSGSATPGNVQTVESTSKAESLFGSDSELAAQVELALSQRVPPSTIYAVGVSETQTTESFTGTDNGTLGNTPVFDPNVQPDHAISAQDTQAASSVDVNIVYDKSPSAPSSSDTINLNPVNGEWVADDSSDYDITYSYGDYEAAIDTIADNLPRIVGVLTEDESLVNYARDALEDEATGFDFAHAVGGVMPEVSAQIATDYTAATDSRRVSAVAPSRAFTDTANTTMVRTVGAVAGKQAGKELGDSTTYESVFGFADLNTKYSDGDLGTLIDSGIYPLKQGARILSVKDKTTDSDVRFERIYASEIVDEATDISHQIAQDFIGERNTADKRLSLRESHASSYTEMSDGDLLDGYTVLVLEGNSDFEVDVDIGLSVVGIMDTIKVTVTVGDVITNGGAA